LTSPSLKLNKVGLRPLMVPQSKTYSFVYPKAAPARSMSGKNRRFMGTSISVRCGAG
jgi:hypothetical protein